MTPVPRLPRAGRPSPAVWLLWLALVWAPIAGHLHAVLHGLPGAGQGAPAHAHGAEPFAGGSTHLHHGLAALFGDHDDAPSCRLYDGAAGGEAACGVAPGPVLAATPPEPAAGAQRHLASRAPLTVRVRGPPLSH